eukprot:gnl/Spiro4/116_TR63_c0_g1_i1.p1 gnl/Spiro4/116_TR63_c0_g1~~gnl/Spiro4/116_TR63_c0_g1_i1.p1  ORF type:complete len:739 (-),score=131.97 gnl/Spiro4/116_TR63_c0_g1_i1:53-2269(-)
MAESSRKKKKRARRPEIALPWKRVPLGDSEIFDGLMGIEELDGRIWKQAQLGTYDKHASEGSGTQQHTAAGSPRAPATVNSGKVPNEQQPSAKRKRPAKDSKPKRAKLSTGEAEEVEQQHQEEEAGSATTRECPSGSEPLSSGKDEQLAKRPSSKKANNAPPKKRARVEKAVQQQKNTQPELTPEQTQHIEQEMENWREFGLDFRLVRGLFDVGFRGPTPTQRAVLPPAVNHIRDLVVAAATGSGKTLAFGLPVMNRLLTATTDGTVVDRRLRPLSALVLVPTRELAMQVQAHLKAVSAHTNLKIACVVGGMALPRQRRVLGAHPDIVVATPGRLWELMTEGEPHVSNLSSLRALVLDEADRMLEMNHFRELNHILTAIYNPVATYDPEFARAPCQESADGNSGSEAQSHPPRDQSGLKQLQTFLTSATMLMEPDDRLNVKHARKSRRPAVGAEQLMSRLRFRGKPCTVDLTLSTKTAEHLTETRIECPTEDKEIHLYLFLLANMEGRTLVFANSIFSIKRLALVLSALKLPCVMSLHANMQMRKRLKIVERFTQAPSAVLVATDVAARGLDIPGIRYVVHFQLPKSTDLYIHRAGRTARAQASGATLLCVGPEDMPAYRKIVSVLGRDVPEQEINTTLFREAKKRVVLAVKLAKAQLKTTKANQEKSWLAKGAEVLGVDWNSDDDDDRRPSQKSRSKQDARELDSCRRELDALLSRKLNPAGTSIRYPTMGRNIVLP